MAENRQDRAEQDEARRQHIIAEAGELVRYAANSGLAIEPALIQDVIKAIAQCEAEEGLAEGDPEAPGQTVAVIPGGANDVPVVDGAETAGAPPPAPEKQQVNGKSANGAYAELVCAYAALVQKTQPVTGHTLIETKTRSKSVLNGLQFGTLLILLCAVVIAGLGVWLTEIPEPEEGWVRDLFEFRASFLEYLSPFIWGALGSCVFLMKRLNRAGRANSDSGMSGFSA